MVEAAGVEPDISVENTQLTDFENASNAENATISKSTVQSLYEHCLKFPELQPSDFLRTLANANGLSRLEGHHVPVSPRVNRGRR